MKKEYYSGNRKNVIREMKNGSLAVFFSGDEIRRSADENYDFFGNRNFLYLTGIEEPGLVLLLGKDSAGAGWEKLYLRRPDAFAERWTGKRTKESEAAEKAAAEAFGYAENFEKDFHRLAVSGNYAFLYADTYKESTEDIDTRAHRFVRDVKDAWPYLQIENGTMILRKLRTIKQPCEIAALRQAEAITREGILAMMRASKPGMYEYQYKAEFDRALGQFGPKGPGFPSIISAGKNNFCIHYYEYSGQALDGDMVLNDVGAQWQNMIVDVSRGWPCNGRFSEKQKLLFECALATSNYMFSILRPGMKMDDVDATIRRYNAERLKDAGVLRSTEEIGTYMWHGGAHHIGYDVHDAIERPEILAPNMVFCVDVGIYHEEWGIGFRLEDNCLITENGCENLSAAIPRTVADIEAVMRKG